MRKIIISIFALSLLIVPFATNAGCCGCDPVYDYSAKGEVKSAVWVRDQACVDTGKIIATNQKGWVVKIIAKTDGWYKVVTPDGLTGWSGETFYTITDKPLTASSSTASATPTPTSTSSSTSETSDSLRRLQGKLLLQVEKGGAIWYVAMTEYKRYQVTFANALPLFEKLSLGITDANLAKIPITGSSQTGDWNLRNRLKGRLLLAVEKGGMIWYVDSNGYRHNVTWSNLMDLFESLSLGITDANLNLIPIGSLDLSQSTVPTTPSSSTPEPTTSSTIEQTFTGAGFISSGSLLAGDGSFQKGSVPSGFNYAVVMQHILDRINYERTTRGKPAIVSDQRMVDTASVWAEQMYEQGQITHTRLPVNMIAREWVWQNFKIGFKEDWGWLYENIGGGSYNRSQGINESIMKSMDSLFDFYMSEEATNGIHYQTIMHDHLTHVGVGFYFDGNNDSGSLYTVLHYGGLNGNILVINKVW